MTPTHDKVKNKIATGAERQSKKAKVSVVKMFEGLAETGCNES
jgi:hypothetical protein